MARCDRRRAMAEINVVPYIDVMLVLLVIFMVTAPLMNQGVEVDLPQATAEQLPRTEEEPIVVSVDINGNYYLNLGENPEQPIEMRALQVKVAAILRHRPDIPVLVRGDQTVEYGHVVRVMTLLQAAGAPSVGLMTQEPLANTDGQS